MAKKYVSLMNTTKYETEKKYVPHYIDKSKKSGQYIPYVEGTCGKRFAAPEMATGKRYVSLASNTATGEKKYVPHYIKNTGPKKYVSLLGNSGTPAIGRYGEYTSLNTPGSGFQLPVVAPFSPGEHQMVLPYNGGPLNIHYYIPHSIFDGSIGVQPSILFAIHGSGSGPVYKCKYGSDYIDLLRTYSERHRFIIIAPIFCEDFSESLKQIPDNSVPCSTEAINLQNAQTPVDKWNAGCWLYSCIKNVGGGPRNNTFYFGTTIGEFGYSPSWFEKPKVYLNDFNFLFSRFDSVQRSDKAMMFVWEKFRNYLPYVNQERFHLCGHSQGAQFVSRFMTFYPEVLDKVMISGPGSCLFPDNLTYPNYMLPSEYLSSLPCQPTPTNPEEYLDSIKMKYPLTMDITYSNLIQEFKYAQLVEQQLTSRNDGRILHSSNLEEQRQYMDSKLLELMKTDVLLYAGADDNLGNNHPTYYYRLWQGDWPKHVIQNYYSRLMAKAAQFYGQLKLRPAELKIRQPVIENDVDHSMTDAVGYWFSNCW